jgi:glycopeptide antibiotics resistance protein
MKLRLLPFAIGIIVITTMVPLELRHPSRIFVDIQFDPWDMLLNLFLYIPLGMAMVESSLARCTLTGFLLSLMAETLQFGYVNRSPSPVDLGFNTVGTVVGYLAARIYRGIFKFSWKTVSLPAPLAIVAIPLAALSVLAMVVHKEPADFSNWSSDFQLAIGNELTGDRPWKGTISKLEIYGNAIDPAVLRKMAEAGPGSLESNSSAIPTTPIFFLKSKAVDGSDFGKPLLNDEENRVFFEKASAHNQLSVLVWMKTASLSQKGPARIVTYSADGYNRNFSLCQLNRTLTFRLRTPATGPNGTGPDLTTRPILSLNRPTLVAAVYDGAISSIYVDGVQIAHVNLAARRPRVPRRLLWIVGPAIPLRDLETNISEYLIGALLCFGLLGISPSVRNLPTRWMVCAAAGIAVGISIWIFAVSEPLFGLRVLLLAIAGALTVGTAVEPI